MNYYKVLKVSPKATNAEIKSAYRRLARKLHPDLNGGAAGATSSEFASVAKAYEILGNPQTRAAYDKKILKEQFASAGASVFQSENPHARRWRQMAYDRRYNEIIDRMIADERRETLALQKVIFPVVGLFVSTCFVAAFKPMVWASSPLVGKFVLLALFAAGVWRLFGRLRAAFERYTYRNENIHDSILEETTPITKPFTRATAVCFLVFGVFLSFGVGLIIGNSLDFLTNELNNQTISAILFSKVKLELVFYPPIFVLLVDLMHTFATRMDN